MEGEERKIVDPSFKGFPFRKDLFFHKEHKLNLQMIQNKIESSFESLILITPIYI